MHATKQDTGSKFGSDVFDKIQRLKSEVLG